MTAALALLCVALAALLAFAWRAVRAQRREAFVRTYMFPPGLFDRLGARRPALTVKDKQLVARALRQFFLAYLRGGRRYVSMPSQVVDELWHEFILYTRDYQAFCGNAFGRFLHHTPAVVLGDDRQHNAGLRRVWWHACLEENINPRRPTRLPLLFALDGKLAIADGFRYVAACDGLRRAGAAGGAPIHCGGDFGSSSYDGGTSGFGDGGDNSSHGHSAHDGAAGGAGASGDSGGDSGGGGCGGGCGGSE